MAYDVDQDTALTWDDVTSVGFGPTVDTAISTGLNAVAAKANLQPLRWHLETETGRLEGLAEADTEAKISQVLHSWAAFLGLAAVEKPMAGAIEYCGDVGPNSVMLWGVADRAAWEK